MEHTLGKRANVFYRRQNGPEEMLFNLGNAIREERRRQKMTQADLAKAAGIGRSTLSQIESGTVTEIGVRKVLRILDYLGLELAVRPRGAPPTLEELRKEQG